MRTSTSATPGVGTGLSTRLSWPGSPSTHAFIAFIFFLAISSVFAARKALAPGLSLVNRVYIICLRPRGLPEGGTDETRAIGLSDRRGARVAPHRVRTGHDAVRYCAR